MITLYNGDCLEEMKKILDGSVDMILTDLPYGVTANKKDIVIPFEPLWEQYERVIKKNGAIVLFGSGLFFIDLVNSKRDLFRYDLVWEKVLKTGFLNAKKMPLRSHENIAVFYKEQPTYNPQFTQGKPLHKKGKPKKDGPVNQNYGKMTDAIPDVRAGSTEKYPASIVTFSKPHPSVAVHPTEKSVDLMEWLIETYTNQNETVLDSTMGSGTTGIACVRTKRSFIGIEMDEIHFQTAKRRIADEEKRNTSTS